MTHNEKRAHWVREASIGLGAGVLYGVTVVVSAHVSDVKYLNGYCMVLSARLYFLNDF